VGIVGYGIWRVAHAVHQAAHGHAVTIPGANGSFSVSAPKSYTAAELGIDIYPGATATQGGLSMNLPNGSWITGAFLTSDSRDQVVAYYKDKMGSSAATMESDEGAVLTKKISDKETVMVTISSKPDQNGGKTKLVILHTKST
jgi:hypothetical protein